LGELVGTYVADLVIDSSLILELKSVGQLTSAMEAQLINYLRLSKIEVGYLINFNGTSLVFSRFVCTRNALTFRGSGSKGG